MATLFGTVKNAANVALARTVRAYRRDTGALLGQATTSTSVGGGDADFASVVTLLDFHGANDSTTIADSGAAPKTYTVQGNARISTAQSKYGGSSLVLDGSGDWVQTTTNLEDFRFGTGDFTCEAWVRTGTPSKVILDFYGSTQAGGWQLYLNGLGYLVWYTSNGTSSVTVLSASAPSVSSALWVHVAACRNGTTLRLFVNGVKVAEGTDSNNYNNTVITPFAIGAQVYSRNASYDFNGNINDVRITKGVARYTADFTPPAAAFLSTGPLASGAFAIDTGSYLSGCTVVVLGEDGGTENALVYDRVIPV